MEYVKYEIKVPKPIVDLVGPQRFRDDVASAIEESPLLVHLHPELTARIRVTKPRGDPFIVDLAKIDE